MRSIKKSRKTSETHIELEFNIDGSGESDIDTGIGFFDHMLQLFSKHGLFDLKLHCKGDLEVDGHHTVEDIGILLGKGLNEALGDKKGIKRYSNIYTPMDEALSLIAMDISGRPYLSWNIEFSRDKVGNFDTELAEEFFRAFVMNSKITLHASMITGYNTHHMIESIFKGLGRALDMGTTIDSRIDGVMSTKGVI
ncbi:imidazoleglycerol-phosphate dehydratase HisB [Dethiothermospora halolimnae]|uniref:imidazoleglycerol-phosphate dehydratase HisB n=1 Tax=Dethiothermospora halolimnae TaxID=3114390 RepID=UPI003CCBCBB9